MYWGHDILLTLFLMKIYLLSAQRHEVKSNADPEGVEEFSHTHHFDSKVQFGYSIYRK